MDIVDIGGRGFGPCLVEDGTRDDQYPTVRVT